jgi:hypothetical protein
LVGDNQVGGILRNNVALNPSIEITAETDTYFGRVAGRNEGVLLNNYGQNGMLILGDAMFPMNESRHDRLNGANIMPADWYDPNWWNSPAPDRWANFPPSVFRWDFSDSGPWNPPGPGSLPTLKNMPGRP